MKRRDGKTNAYILNLMIHSDTRFMDQYQLVERVNKRFHYHYKPNELMRDHIQKLVDRHWLVKIKDSRGIESFARFGGFKRVNPIETLEDQFKDISPELLASYMDYVDSEAWESLDFFDSMSEKQYEEYWQNEYEKYLEYQKESVWKLTPEEIEELERIIN